MPRRAITLPSSPQSESATRVRNSRTGRWIDLPEPPPPDMAWIRVKRSGRVIMELRTAEEIQKFYAANIADFDKLSTKERWRINYCRATTKISALPFPTDPPQWDKLHSPLFADDIGL